MPRRAGIVTTVACLALAACATQESVQQAQSQATRAVATTQNQETALKSLTEREGRHQQELTVQLTQIQAQQVAANKQLQMLANKLDKLHGELRTQATKIPKALPKTPAPAASARAPATTTTVSAPVTSSVTNALYARIAERAGQIALGKASAPDLPQAPNSLQHLDYAAYQAIRYVGQLADWNGSDTFKLKFHPAGFVFNQSIQIHLNGQQDSPPLDFTSKDFHWPSQIGNGPSGEIPVAGFRVGQLYDGGQSAPFLDFLGASYFQAAPPGKPFGLSARGVSIDTGVSNTAEEFPSFVEFWLGAPADSQLDVVALLASDSLDGAYRFEVLPEAKQTTMQITATLYLTHTVAQLGISPLTSMYLQGPDSLNRPDAVAKAVHDSDGLLIHDGEGWMWVPLYNPARLQVLEIAVNNLRGFGLLQRDRKYDDYQDSQDNYQNHPNAWVEPTNDWGSGVVKLVEIPAQYSSNSNIVAFWTPANPPAPQQVYRFAYRLAWSLGGPGEGELGRVLATRIVDLKGGHYAVMIDFGGGALADLPTWVDVKPTISASDNDLKIENVTLTKIVETDRWRLGFEVSGGGNNDRITAWLHYGERVLSERWMRQRPGS
ncbi:MAG: glucan biosynthesis protein [Gammaproteobacteria bacterium]